MIALLQRAARGMVRIDGKVVGEIAHGLVVFLCAERDDQQSDAEALLNKLLRLRMFADADGKMNCNVSEVGGGLLLVPQFTLAADTRSGTRPSFSTAAAPELAARLFVHFVALARKRHPMIACGEFGAMMQVELVNDGPVTFWLQTRSGQEGRLQ
jgi:D-tyrosyl-tRNA(Tyr) deacylase